jgi:hypothetical protein
VLRTVQAVAFTSERCCSEPSAVKQFLILALCKLKLLSAPSAPSAPEDLLQLAVNTKSYLSASSAPSAVKQLLPFAFYN